MSSLLEEVCAILDDFESKIAKVRAIWKQLEEDNPWDLSLPAWERGLKLADN